MFLAGSDTGVGEGPIGLSLLASADMTHLGCWITSAQKHSANRGVSQGSCAQQAWPRVARQQCAMSRCGMSTMCNFPHSCKENRTPSTVRNGHVTITLGLASCVNNPRDCHARGRLGGIACKNAHTHTHIVCSLALVDFCPRMSQRWREHSMLERREEDARSGCVQSVL